MKAYILQLGYIMLDSNNLLVYATRATIDNPNRPADWIKAPVWALVVDTGDHKMIFDLGCLPDAMEETGWPKQMQDRMPWYCPEGQSMEEQLALIGMTPADIDTVVLSHFHADHFGNIELFKHCDIYVPEEDWVAALKLTHMDPTLGRNGSYHRRCMDIVVKQYHPITIEDGDFELFPGVEVITLPGHTWNLLGLVLHLDKDGCLIFPSDAIPLPEVYGPPARFSGVMQDSKSFMKSIEKVRKLQKKYNAQVMFSHCSKTFETFKHAPEFYE